ncbi:hypothetical protein CH63R_14606 [Colletotrichum higginsianum IMI 349063]|uniref:Uncharacterized protein n=1 Tax=Colletotrichum higginsianum (strain IMI 349063) TaxID=759273 RepID=A0A1B7XQN3_COLHI|nr:hypothetical protein CH63R_14606 [Colletotrichum higginsianum IMI 349063]OBR02034.1 hypothetical protein CH63R_14606 [Colletotrichum higginsianum IMI 349063]
MFLQRKSSDKPESGRKRDSRTGGSERESRASGSESSRRLRRKQEMLTTYENIITALEQPVFKHIDGSSMRAFLTSLYYHSAGDRTKPITLPRTIGLSKGAGMTLYPEGMVISREAMQSGDRQLVEAYGKLKIRDEDDASTVLSLGFAADSGSVFNYVELLDAEEEDKASYRASIPPPRANTVYADMPS